jgi:hypothetical protein
LEKQKSLLILFFLLIVSKSLSQDFQINLLKLDFANDQLIITYSIDDKNASDKFIIQVEIKRQNGELIQSEAITGDIGENIKSGNTRRILWDLGKDSIYLDEDISVKIKGEKNVKSYNKGKLILMSAVFPGWGQTKMTGKPWWIGGLAVYGTLAGGIIYHKKYLDTYDLYLNAGAQTRQDLAQQYEKEYNISKALIIASASLWVANIIWVAVAPNHEKPLKHANLYIEPVTIPYHQGATVSLRVDF